MPLYAAAVLIGAARILESLLGVPYEYALAAFSLLVAVYVLIGGLRGVMYTDALQGTLMIAGMLFLLVAMFIKLGGPIDAFSKLHAMKELVPPESAAAGHQGWLSDPKVFSPVWWTLYSSLVFGVGVGVLAQPHLAVRCLTVKTSAELNRAAAVGGVFILITVATPYVLGALSNVFFYEKDGVLASCPLLLIDRYGKTDTSVQNSPMSSGTFSQWTCPNRRCAHINLSNVRRCPYCLMDPNPPSLHVLFVLHGFRVLSGRFSHR